MPEADEKEQAEDAEELEAQEVDREEAEDAEGTVLQNNMKTALIVSADKYEDGKRVHEHTLRLPPNTLTQVPDEIWDRVEGHSSIQSRLGDELEEI